MGFAILSVLTGVVCDKMAKAAEEHKAEMDKEDAKMREVFAREDLEQLFDSADGSGDGLMVFDEFRKHFLDDEEKGDDLCDAVDLDKQDLAKIFQVIKSERLDSAGVAFECITRQDFIEGLMFAGRDVKEISLIRMEKELIKVERLVKRIAPEGASQNTHQQVERL